MISHVRSIVALAAAAVVTVVAVGAAPLSAQHAGHGPYPARFLYAWTGDADRKDSDFLAIIDAREGSATYGHVLKTVPAGASGLYPHHTEQMLSGTQFFANGFTHRTVIWDAADPLAPRLTGELEHVHGFHHVHSFLRLDDGNVLATVQYGDSTVPGNPGGIALFNPQGKVLRTSSSADAAFPGARIRTYSLDANRASDRILTVSSPMDDERTADVFQLWRLSDLALLRTVRLEPEPDSSEAYPFEARFLAGGRTALMSTYYCGLYFLRDLDTGAPTARLVHRFATENGNRGCGVPLVVSHYWVMPVAYGAAVIVLDVADPERPREVSRLQMDTTFRPHWLSPDPGSDRIVLVDQGDNGAPVLMLRLDRATGALRYDQAFRDAGSARPGVSFRREGWPHGASGHAVPHGTFFVP
ncbi:MAG TPA: hypothetical protein VFZ56_09535 [Gemmatimonadaceae bacterium]